MKVIMTLASVEHIAFSYSICNMYIVHIYFYSFLFYSQSKNESNMLRNCAMPPSGCETVQQQLQPTNENKLSQNFQPIAE